MTVVDIVAGLEAGRTVQFDGKYWGLFFEELAKYGKQISLDVRIENGLVILKGKSTGDTA